MYTICHDKQTQRLLDLPELLELERVPLLELDLDEPLERTLVPLLRVELERLLPDELLRNTDGVERRLEEPDTRFFEDPLDRDIVRE